MVSGDSWLKWKIGVAIGLVAIAATAIWHRAGKKDDAVPGRYLWHVSVTDASGAKEEFDWDARRTRRELRERLSPLVTNLLSAGTPTAPHRQTLGSVCLDYGYAQSLKTNRQYSVVSTPKGEYELVHVSADGKETTIVLAHKISGLSDLVADVLAGELLSTQEFIQPY